MTDTYETIHLTNGPDADFGRPLLPPLHVEQASLFDDDEGGSHEPERDLVGAVDELTQAVSDLMGDLRHHADATNRLARAIERLVAREREEAACD